MKKPVTLKLGIFNSLLYNGKGTFSRITHEWDYLSEVPNMSGPIHTSILRENVDSSEIFVGFEEDIGRYFNFRNGKVNIVDIVTVD